MLLKKDSTFKKVLKSFIGTTGKWPFIFMVIFWVFVFSFSTLEPIIISKIIAEIEALYITGEVVFENIIFLICVWIAYIVLKVWLTYIYDFYFSMKYSVLNFHEINSYFAKKIIKMSLPEYLSKKTGWIYKILNRWTDDQFFFTRDIFAEILSNITIILVTIGIIFYINPTMAWISLIPLPIMLIIGTFIYKKLAPKQRETDKKYDKIYENIGNIMSNFSLTKTLNLEKIFQKNIDWILRENFKIQNWLNAGWSLSHVYVQGIVMMARLLVIWSWAFFIAEGKLTFAELFLFFSYVTFIYYPLSFIFTKLRQFQKQLVSIERMYTELETLEQDDDTSGKTVKQVNWDIVFKNVWFWYSDDKDVISDISFEIKKGQRIALVWDTGAGKSTIVNLLLRFWDVSSGEILLDNININTLKKSSLRSHIWVVSQDNSLFNLSIEENLKFANNKATKKDLEKALKNAEASFVYDLPNGIKTVIWERWLKLSGGEKQRVSIARLFLKNPEIIVLDEATSALDNKTEGLIQKSLDRLMKWKTTIIIAHRLSTIQNVDKIFVLENGKIVESWNYTELMKNKKGKFYGLANPDHLILG